MRAGVVAVVLACAGCGRIGFGAPSGVGDDISGGDAAGGDDAGGDAANGCATTVWGSFVHQGNLATSSQDWEPTLSPDGLHIVFSSDRSGAQHLYYSSRSGINGVFAAPAELTQLESGDLEYAPQWARDGTHLFWHHHGGDSILHYERVGIANAGATISFDLPSRAEITQTLDRDATVMLADEREVFYTLGKANRKDVGWSMKPSAAAPFASYADQTLPSTFNGTVAAFNDGWPTFDETRQELWWERDDESVGTTEFGPRILSATRSGDGMPFDSTINEHPELGKSGDPDIDADGMAMALAADMTGPPAGLPNTGFSDIYTATRNCQ